MHCGPKCEPDGSIYVQLEKALYGLPEAGRLWHEHLTSILRKIGYEQSEGSPCEWRKLDTRNREIIAESYVLIFVDEVLHYYNGVGIEGKSIRDKLHEDLCRTAFYRRSPTNFLRKTLSPSWD